MEKVEYYVVKPSSKLFGGVKVDKDTEFECTNNDGTVHQKLKDLVLITEITKEMEQSGIKSKEESKMTTELPEGIVLLWSEETGYIVPNYVMIRPEEAVKCLEEIVNTTKPIEEGTNKAKEA